MLFKTTKTLYCLCIINYEPDDFHGLIALCTVGAYLMLNNGQQTTDTAHIHTHHRTFCQLSGSHTHAKSLGKMCVLIVLEITSKHKAEYLNFINDIDQN